MREKYRENFWSDLLILFSLIKYFERKKNGKNWCKIFVQNLQSNAVSDGKSNENDSYDLQ